MHDGIHYQAQEYFKPVDCKHIEYVREDTEDTKGFCPFHSDSWMQSCIGRSMMDSDRGEADRKDREARTGRKEGGENSVIQKVKKAFRALVFDEYS